MTIALTPPSAEATRLILLRHGEPDESVHGRCYGRVDPGLSPRGREQMRRMWRPLNTHPVAAIYSSPRRRAVESADLRPGTHPAVIVDDRLREIDFGVFEGLTYDEIADRHPDTYDTWMTSPTDVGFPGGERFSTMFARVCAGLDEIRRAHAGRTVAIVAHGGVNRIALAHALSLDSCHLFRLAQSYGCMNVIDYVADEPVVHVMNVTVDRC